MRVLIVSSEIAPFAKTGGLGDVAGAIPKALEGLGVETAAIMPLYRQVRQSGATLEDTGCRISVPVGQEKVKGRIFSAILPGSNVKTYFIANDRFYDRQELYSMPLGDYPDNSARFIFFSRGVLEAVKALGERFDVLHCNDWQTGLLPVYLKTLYGAEKSLAKTATLFTIHNIAYQGIFWHWDMKIANLEWNLFNYRQLEFHGSMNFLKGGIVFGDVVTTVSRTYAEEIQTPQFGAGLEGAIAQRRGDVYGVINGIDYDAWDPASDKLIPANYSPSDMSGKARCKAELQKSMGLARDPRVPLIGMIGRLISQKGFDLVVGIIEELMGMDLQLAILGTGAAEYHRELERIARTYPGKVAVRLEFDDALAHRIEAGADMFLMPSLYEPCGLNQLYSLKYGTVPIVRHTGGLADTIVDCTPATLRDGAANGFAFRDYTPEALLECTGRALELYGQKKKWSELVANGMAQDWSWGHSAGEYIELYRKAMEKRANG